MKRSDAFPSQYLSKDDVESPVIGTIADVQFVTLKGDNGDEQKPAMYFKESTIKPLLVNNSNWMTCEDLYGEDSDGWRGHTIEIFKDPSVMFGGKRVGGVRLRKPGNGHKPSAAGGADLAEITQAWNTAQTRDNFVALCNAIGANAEHVKAAFGDGGVKAWLAVEGHTPATAVKQLADVVANLF